LQYYVHFKDDPDIPLLHHCGILTAPADFEREGGVVKLSPSILKKRLILFLEVFSAVISPKQLYKYNLLYIYYITLLSNSVTTVSKLALQSLITYKPAYLMPYKDRILRLLDDNTIRDELVVFNLSATISNPVIDSRHRSDIIPLIVRLVYGRFVSKAKNNKSARDLNISRRVAVLTFLNTLSSNEHVYFMQLMFRGMIPIRRQMENSIVCEFLSETTLTEYFSPWFTHIDELIENLNDQDIKYIPFERQMGFLYLLEDVVNIIGYGVASYVPKFFKAILCCLHFAQSSRNENLLSMAVEENNENEGGGELASDAEACNVNQNASTSLFKIRTLCLLRIGGDLFLT